MQRRVIGQLGEQTGKSKHGGAVPCRDEEASVCVCVWMCMRAADAGQAIAAQRAEADMSDEIRLVQRVVSRCVGCSFGRLTIDRSIATARRFLAPSRGRIVNSETVRLSAVCCSRRLNFSHISLQTLTDCNPPASPHSTPLSAIASVRSSGRFHFRLTAALSWSATSPLTCESFLALPSLQLSLSPLRAPRTA